MEKKKKKKEEEEEEKKKKCWSCGVETVNHISECNKLAQKKYKTRHDWSGNVSLLELCKRLKFHPTNNWYMLKSGSVQKEKRVKKFSKILKYIQITQFSPED